MHNFKEFLDYCESFYSPSHPDVLYPIDGLTRGELALATLSYLDLCAASDGTVSWGDGDPDLQFTPQEEYVMHQRCLGRWTAYNEDDLRNRIFDFIGYHAEHLKYEVRS